MWEIMVNGGLGQKWPIPNSWDKGQGDVNTVNLE